MISLKESLLSKTSQKMDDIKVKINEVPPQMSDWKISGRHVRYIEYRCPNLIQANIDLLSDSYFEGNDEYTQKCNPLHLKKSELTKIRCYILNDCKPPYCGVELCGDDTCSVYFGVQLVGLNQYCNGETVNSAKKKVVDFFNKIQFDDTSIMNIFKTSSRGLEMLKRDGYFVADKLIWKF